MKGCLVDSLFLFMLKNLSILFFILLSIHLRAQESYFYKTIDTVKSVSRMGGVKLDSIDLIFSEKFISTPGAYFSHPFGKFGNDYFSFFSNLTKQHREFKPLNFKLSAIPHLGTYYAFGSKGTQYLLIDFNQSFSSKLHFSLSYHRNVSSGAYRYNAFANDVFSTGFLYKGYKWAHLMTLSTNKQYRSLNGGVSSFDEIKNYGLEFAKVRKQNSSDSISQIEIKTETEYGLIVRDSIRRLSLVLNNNLTIDKRVFREKDSLSTLYPNESIKDSLLTRDLSQFSRLDNQIGIRYKIGKFNMSLLLDNGYWKYKTINQNIVNELDVNSKFDFKGRKWHFLYVNQYNLKGAKQQNINKLMILGQNRLFDFSCELLQINLLPTPMQRFYYSNTLNYLTHDLKLQETQSIKFDFKTKQKQTIQISAYAANFKNHYYFIQNKWRNDTLNSISQISLQFKGDLNIGVFHLQPNLAINFLNKVQLIPKYDLRARLFIKKEMKRPGTVFNFGVDMNYKSTYRLLTFDDRISLYKMDFTNSYFLNYTNFDAFISMQLDEFRMYFKAENIDSYWNSPVNMISKNYPVVPLILRLGITWDFFN